MSFLLQLPTSHPSSLNQFAYHLNVVTTSQVNNPNIQSLFQKSIDSSVNPKNFSSTKQNTFISKGSEVFDAEMFLKAIDFANKGEFQKAKETIVQVLKDAPDHIEAIKLQQFILCGQLFQRLMESALEEKNFNLVVKIANVFVKNFGFNHYMQQWIDEAKLLESIRKAYESKDYSKLKHLANEYLITYGNDKYVILLEADLAMQVSLDPMREDIRHLTDNLHYS